MVMPRRTRRMEHHHHFQPHLPEEYAMKLELHGKGVRLNQRLRSHVERRLRFALDRFGGRVRRVRVRLQDLNGPRGGEDIRCHIQAWLTPGQMVLVEETRADPFTAVARASDRIGHNISRRFGRFRDRFRRRR